MGYNSHLNWITTDLNLDFCLSGKSLAIKVYRNIKEAEITPAGPVPACIKYLVIETVCVEERAIHSLTW